jgi:RimJ/RimL family protein N-acetyltransferase
MSKEKFILRELQMSDAESLAENANNINIWNNLFDIFPHPYSIEDAKEFIEKKLEKPKPTTDFAIVVDEKVVGGISIILQENVNLRIVAEIGFWLGEKYWNRGIMSEAIKQIAEYAFTTFPHLRKIYANVFDFNIGSQKVLQKAGFEREAILKQGAIKNGKVIDLHYYSLLKSEWRSKVSHRFFTQDDFPILEDLLYEAVYQPEGAELLSREIIKKPEIYNYIKDFGTKKGDFCMLAELNGKTVGAAWVRILADEIKGFGNIDPETPELAVAVFKKYRNLGIGRGLLNNVIDLTLINGLQGYKQLSLSVQKENFAVKMYQKLGFEIIKENEHDYVMVLKRK